MHHAAPVLQQDVLLLLVEVADQLLRPVLVPQPQPHRPAVVEDEPLEQLVELHEARPHDLGVDVLDLVLVLAVVVVAAEEDEVAGDAVDEFVVGVLHGEDLVGGALEHVADVAHHPVEEHQLQVALEVPARELARLLLVLDLQHVLYVVQVRQGAQLVEPRPLFYLVRVLPQQAELPGVAVNCPLLRLEPVDDLLELIEELFFALDEVVAQVDDPPAVGAQRYPVHLFLVDELGDLYEEILLVLALQSLVELLVQLRHHPVEHLLLPHVLLPPLALLRLLLAQEGVVGLEGLLDGRQDGGMDVAVEAVAIVGDGFPNVDHLVEPFFELEPDVGEGVVRGTNHLALDLEFVALVVEISVDLGETLEVVFQHSLQVLLVGLLLLQLH